MAERNDFTNAVSGVALGMLANDCAIAIARAISGEPLSQRDETALHQARNLLSEIMQLAGDQVVIARTKPSVGPVLSLDEAILPRTLDEHPEEDLSVAIEYLLTAVQSVLDGSLDDENALTALASFFDRLAAVARETSESLISQETRRQTAWTEPLLNS